MGIKILTMYELGAQRWLQSRCRHSRGDVGPDPVSLTRRNTWSCMIELDVWESDMDHCRVLQGYGTLRLVYVPGRHGPQLGTVDSTFGRPNLTVPLRPPVHDVAS